MGARVTIRSPDDDMLCAAEHTTAAVEILGRKFAVVSTKTVRGMWRVEHVIELAEVVCTRAPIVDAEGMVEAEVRWYDAQKGWGFLIGKPDIFLHASVVMRSGVDSTMIARGTRLRVLVTDDGRGPAALAVRLPE